MTLLHLLRNSTDWTWNNWRCCPSFIIYGGYIILTSQGDPNQLNTGKSYIYYAIGIVLAILVLFYSSYTVDILHIPVLIKDMIKYLPKIKKILLPYYFSTTSSSILSILKNNRSNSCPTTPNRTMGNRR